MTPYYIYKQKVLKKGKGKIEREEEKKGKEEKRGKEKKKRKGEVIKKTRKILLRKKKKEMDKTLIIKEIAKDRCRADKSIEL